MAGLYSFVALVVVLEEHISQLKFWIKPKYFRHTFFLLTKAEFREIYA